MQKRFVDQIPALEVLRSVFDEAQPSTIGALSDLRRPLMPSASIFRARGSCNPKTRIVTT
jgi:hypothetical protein